jgi:hypothetical protein
VTDEEIRYRYKNMSRTYDRVKILAELNDCDKRDIEAVLGFKSTRKSKMLFDDVDSKYIVKLYKFGLGMKRISQWYKCNQMTIRDVLLREGVTIRARHQQGGRA